MNFKIFTVIFMLCVYSKALGQTPSPSPTPSPPVYTPGMTLGKKIELAKKYIECLHDATKCD